MKVSAARDEAKPRKVQKGYSLPADLVRAVEYAAVDRGVRPCAVVERALRDAFASQPKGQDTR